MDIARNMDVHTKNMDVSKVVFHPRHFLLLSFQWPVFETI
jgi:hypothetical protein